MWSNNFFLIGVDFDSDMVNMDTNFRGEMDDIKKLYNSWLYRYLKHFGRISVMKSLALLTLSHVVLVCPHIDPEVLGGLTKPDIGTFWDSLKMSWAGRLLANDGF